MTLEFRPAEEKTGIVFVRTDLAGSPRIPAVIQNRVPGPRRTTLVDNGCAVEMVEHVMAALAGMKIDNCEVRVDRAEMPGMDGSSICFVEALLHAGREEQTLPRETLVVTEPTRVEEGDSWIQANPCSDHAPRFSYQLDYPHQPCVGAQSYSATIDEETFIREIAPARTFLLKSEAELLQKQGLGTRVTHQDVLVFDDNGPIDNSLRFSDECARHKLLDVIGDLALSGKDMYGEFQACKSGHRMNSQMVFALLQQVATGNLIRKTA